MPKKKQAKVNKSQVIRDALAEHKTASTGEIAVIVNKQGLDVDANYVSAVKSQLKARRKKKKAARKKAAAADSSDQFSLAALVEIKKVAEKVGGIDKAREALDALKKLG